MRLFSYIVALLTALALMGCGAHQKKEAAAPESDPWKDYKGTFASGVPTKEELKKADEAENPKKAEAPKKSDKPEKTDGKAFVASNKKTPESKAAESKPAEMKPVPVNDARSMYNETGGDTAAAAEAIGEEAAPAPKKGGKKAGKKGGGGKKAGAGKKGAAKK